MSAQRPRVLFVGNSSYDLPLPGWLAKKWDLLAERVDLRVIARAGTVAGEDPRFRLIRLAHARTAGAFHAALSPVLVREAREFAPDVIIAQGPYEALPVLAVRRALPGDPKLVVEIHGDWRTAARVYGSPGRRLVAGAADRAAVFALRHADGTRALAPFTEALAVGATGRPSLARFPTYTDLDSFLAEPLRPLPQQPAIAWVGVLQRYKNPDLFARAWRTVAAAVPEARATIVGDGPLRRPIDELVREFPGRVRAIRRLSPPEVARLLDESTALALPSWSEGLPRVAIEALTRGRPVIGSTGGGIPDIVRDGHNGLLAPAGDAAAFADALTRVLKDRPLAERLSAGARADAPGFQWRPDRYADAVRGLVDAALAGRHR